MSHAHSLPTVAITAVRSVCPTRVLTLWESGFYSCPLFRNRRRLVIHRNILGRFLEAHGRGIWKNASAELLDTIRSQLDVADAAVEGVQL